jgi:rare lipoprotein A
VLFATLAFAGCASVPTRVGDSQFGVASWYGKQFAGRRTASGSYFNPREMTAAHRTLPFGTRILVTRVDDEEEHSVIVTVTDRGPYAKDRIIDLSYAAARKLGFAKAGTAKVKLEILRQ